MEEEAKAVQEVAKATGKTVEALREVGGFIYKVFGEALFEYGRTKLDNAKLYRYKNALRIMDEVNEIHRQRKLEGKPIPIPPRFAIPLLEKASLEDREEIQKLWAGLIANATDTNRRYQFQKIYIQILSNLESLDAAILDLLFTYKNNDQMKLNSEKISEILKQDRQYINISLSNLFRLGCIIDTWINVYDSEIPKNFQGVRVNNPISDFSLSQLGKSLMEACKTS